MINTVIIDPKKRDRDKISSLLSEFGGIKVLACGEDGYDAMKFVVNLKPDVAIVDNQLEYIGGEEIAPLLKLRSPSTAVLIITSQISDNQLFKAACGKVSGFVNKETDIEILPYIIECVSGGGCFISPVLAGRILCLLSGKKRNSGQTKNFPAEQGMDPTRFLSKTELRILTGIGQGKTSAEIAAMLGFTVGTTRNNISTVMRKTGLRNRSQMACYALSYGLVPFDPGNNLPY